MPVEVEGKMLKNFRPGATIVRASQNPFSFCALVDYNCTVCGMGRVVLQAGGHSEHYYCARTFNFIVLLFNVCFLKSQIKILKKIVELK